MMMKRAAFGSRAATRQGPWLVGSNEAPHADRPRECRPMSRRMVVVASSVADLQKTFGKAGSVSVEEGKSGSTKVSDIVHHVVILLEFFRILISLFLRGGAMW